jgi:hypothetical protein
MVVAVGLGSAIAGALMFWGMPDADGKALGLMIGLLGVLNMERAA